MRFGTLAPQSAIHWTCDRYGPPAPRGIYAMPYGFMDYYYIWDGLATDPSPRMRYIRDANGRKLFYDDVKPYNKSLFEEEDALRKKIQEESPHIDWDTARRQAEWALYPDKELAAYLKEKYHIKSLDEISSEPRPSWVMVMDDPSNPPRYTRNPFDPSLTPEDVETIPLNQKLHFLMGENHKRIPFKSICNYRCTWEPDRYWFDFEPFSWEEFNIQSFVDEQTLKIVDSQFEREYNRIRKKYDCFNHNEKEQEQQEKRFIMKWLEKKGIRLEQLCPWPIYAKKRDSWAVVRTAPHIFEYSGPLWHELGAYVKPGDIIKRSGEWVYTEIGAFEEAIRKFSPYLLERARHSQLTPRSWKAGLVGNINKSHYKRNARFEGIQVFIEGKLNESRRK